MSTPQVKETWKQKLFSSKGRINRLNYLLYNIALQIVASIAQFIFITALAFIAEDSAIIGVILFILTSVFVIACIYSGICLTIKRWQYDAHGTSYLIFSLC